MADAPYQVPAGTLPLLAGVLETMDFTHRNMMQIVADLPASALAWKPGADMSSLSGIVRHTIYWEIYAVRRAAGEEVSYDNAYEISLWDAADDADALMACIGDGDAVIKRILPRMTVERMTARYPAWGQSTPTLSGSLIAEAVSHTCMHWGHMQLTRHLWEQAHPDVPSAYEHWR